MSRMAIRWYSIVVDSRDHHTLARWWAQVLDWKIVYEDEDETAVARDADLHPEPGLVFVPVPEEKTVKNRLHIDLAPDDQAAEVERLLSLGATRADVGQGPDVTWVVLRDPEGNEFCVLSAR
jgi:predicted enzyme related to lactoylglutathione lyase